MQRCNIPLPNYQRGCDGKPLIETKPLQAKSLSEINVPPQMLQRMRDYALLLRKKYPHWKPAKLQRKVAEHFKIKLT